MLLRSWGTQGSHSCPLLVLSEMAGHEPIPACQIQSERGSIWVIAKILLRKPKGDHQVGGACLPHHGDVPALCSVLASFHQYLATPVFFPPRGTVDRENHRVKEILQSLMNLTEPDVEGRGPPMDLSALNTFMSNQALCVKESILLDPCWPKKKKNVFECL